MTNRAMIRAQQVFVHYMTFTWEEIGIRVDSDNIAEWRDIIDDTADAGRREAFAQLEPRIRKLEERITDLELSLVVKLTGKQS